MKWPVIWISDMKSFTLLPEFDLAGEIALKFVLKLPALLSPHSVESVHLPHTVAAIVVGFSEAVHHRE